MEPLADYWNRSGVSKEPRSTSDEIFIGAYRDRIG